MSQRNTYDLTKFNTMNSNLGIKNFDTSEQADEYSKGAITIKRSSLIYNNDALENIKSSSNCK